jgi:hypothetical protein
MLIDIPEQLDFFVSDRAKLLQQLQKIGSLDEVPNGIELHAKRSMFSRTKGHRRPRRCGQSQELSPV